ncbi:hypothetical protein PSN01_00637 [Micromonospora saelicesensis]|nr:hypothetical protein PSN01_00637 [Micromonospora saelicesensis]
MRSAKTAYAVSSLAASPVGWPWVSPACNWANPASVSRSTSSNPTGVTRMFAPQPFEATTVASCQRTPRLSSAQARRHVMPGARLLSGLTAQARKRCRSSGSTASGVNDGASCSAQPTASAIWVSSVTSAGSPDRSRGPAGPYRRSISATVRNSVGLPSASP